MQQINRLARPQGRRGVQGLAMSRLKTLLRGSSPSTCNAQQPLLQVCRPVAQHTQHAQQPLLHVVRPSPCNTQQAELRVLVEAVAVFHGFTPAQTAEAHLIAEGDYIAALECFRSLAERDGLPWK